MRKELLEILAPTSLVTQAIGRRIGSKKNSTADIKELIEALEHVKDTLETVHRMMVTEDQAIEDIWKCQ